MRLETGAQIGPYRIDSLLGAGGMGEVYSAYDPRLHRNVAIKLLSNRAASDEQVRRFQQEARAAGILNHPNILTVHEIGGERGSLYIVSELLQGSTLRTTLNKEHRLSIRRTVEYGVQIARGLDAAHAAGIVHRDLKPENVFLMRDGRVKILDFGIAKLHVAEPVLTGPNDTTRSVGLTVPGMIVGTVPYMSPEQVNGDEIDRRSDIFSFGIVLYEMLCGRQPFHGSSPHDTIHAILHDDPQSPSSIRPDVPAGLEAIVLSCLAKSPSERFQSAADLAIALQAVTMPTQTGPLPAPPPRRSRPRAVAAITAAGVVITAIAIAAAVLFHGTRSSNVTYQQMTFRQGTVYNARFASKGNAIVYSASWGNAPPDIYVATLPNPFARSLQQQNGVVEAVLPTNEVLFRRGSALEVVPLQGGTPHKLCDDVVAADAGPEADVTIAHRLPAEVRVEWPIGSAVYTTNWIVPDSLRVSPDGRSIAFFELGAHGARAQSYDLVMLDSAHVKHVLTRGWTFVQSPAWTPDSRELWFTASQIDGVATNLYAVTTSGKQRLLSISPVSFAFDEILKTAQGSRALLNSFQGGFETVVLSDGKETSFSGSVTRLADLSHDGRTALLDDVISGEHHTYICATDGTNPVSLSAGRALALSPDATEVIGMMDEVQPRLLLIPTHSGRPHALPLGPLEAVSGTAAWFPDGKRIAFDGHIHGRLSGVFQQRLDNGAIAQLSPEGEAVSLATLRAVSPDGAWILVRTASDGIVHLLNVGRGTLTDARGILPKDVPMQWSHDGKEVFVLAEREACPAKVFRVNPFSGQRMPWNDIAPANRSGVHYIERVRVSDDERVVIFSFARELGQVFIATGLQ